MVDQKIYFLQSDQELLRGVALQEQIQGQSFSKGHYFLHAKGN